jgi:hypothetical protein
VRVLALQPVALVVRVLALVPVALVALLACEGTFPYAP